MTSIIWLDETNPETSFPSPDRALSEPNGLLALGGDLSTARLLNAYQQGIFPWYEVGQPILWWSPDPRAVLFLDEFKLHRSLRKKIRQTNYQITFDQNFEAVINSCAAPRGHTNETWITPEMQSAYTQLHGLGYAHSVEVWNKNGQLVGGLYGVALGQIFFGESMFSRERDTSKIALATLACHLESWGFPLIDCQQDTRHMSMMGARVIKRADFTSLLKNYCLRPPQIQGWIVDPSLRIDLWHPKKQSRGRINA